MTPVLAKLFIKDCDNVRDSAVRRKYGTLGGLIGLVSNLLLFGAKLFVAVLSGAISVLADALNNLSDAGSSVVTLFGFRMAGKPADREHPFGHGRIEYVAGLIVALLILVMGVELIVNSVQKIITPVLPEFNIVTMIILGIAIIVKVWMAVQYRTLGKKISSPALNASAKDSISDVAATSAVLVGVLVGYFTGVSIDAYLGIAVGLLIIYSGIMAGKECLSPLLGQTPSKELIEEIKTEVMKFDEVIGIHDLIIHDYGPGRKLVSLHAEVRADSDMLMIHDVIDNIERELKKKFECETTIHMDPVDTDDRFTAQITGIMEGIATQLDSQLKIHDLRTVRGNTHTNIVFDCVVPFRFGTKDDEVEAYFDEQIKLIDPTYYTVVHVERDYAQE